MATCKRLNKNFVRRTSERPLGALSTLEVRKRKNFRTKWPGLDSNQGSLCYSVANFLGRKQTELSDKHHLAFLSTRVNSEDCNRAGWDTEANAAIRALDCLISSHLISPFNRVSCLSQSIEVIYFRYKTNYVVLIKFSTYLRLNSPNRLTLLLSSKKEREMEPGRKSKVRK